MKYIVWTLALLLCGCRTALYVAIGPQKVDKVKFELTNQEADPNIPDIVEAAVRAAVGKWNILTVRRDNE